MPSLSSQRLCSQRPLCMVGRLRTFESHPGDLSPVYRICLHAGQSLCAVTGVHIHTLHCMGTRQSSPSTCHQYEVRTAEYCTHRFRICYEPGTGRHHSQVRPSRCVLDVLSHRHKGRYKRPSPASLPMHNPRWHMACPCCNLSLSEARHCKACRPQFQVTGPFSFAWSFQGYKWWSTCSTIPTLRARNHPSQRRMASCCMVRSLPSCWSGRILHNSLGPACVVS